MTISVSICNLALGELRAPPIVDIDEDTLEARECARVYPHVLSLLLNLPDHQWSIATARQSLAELAVNDRPEWSHCYALPNDFSSAIAINNFSQAAENYYAHNFNQRCSMYEIYAGKLYSNQSQIVLDYQVSALEESRMFPLFIDAMVYALAARLAVPILNDGQKEQVLTQRAEIAMQRAVAFDRNRQDTPYLSLLGQVYAARGG